MAHKASSKERPPKGWKPTQAVADPIINNPYDEPEWHWIYKSGIPDKLEGRRPASYWFKEQITGSKGQQSLFQEESRDDLPLVNRLRQDVKRWRMSGYRGATTVTRDLLYHWTRDDRPRRLFFCQREAVETIIYLLEIAIPGRLSSTRFKAFQVNAENLNKVLKGEKPSFDEMVGSDDFFPRLVDPSEELCQIDLRRLGCKMATGSGKTIVMAMLIAWAFCNRGRNPASSHFPNAVLICAPNLTVRKRLQVLMPEALDNYYDSFDIVPEKYRTYLNIGKVLIFNWHKLAPKSEHVEGGTSYKVVKKGQETPDAFTLDRLSDIADRLPILVLNDEGHHCWRPKLTYSDKDLKDAEKGLSKEEKTTLKEEAEEARVWLAGLDKINNCGLLGLNIKGAKIPAIMACIDLSATPFYLGNSGYPEGSPFPWLVSDFGLVDAIECGITKVPRLPIADDIDNKDDAGRPDPKYFRLWSNIKDNCHSSEKVRNTPKPDAVYKYAQDALLTLASQWKVQFDKANEDSEGKPFIPPVLIVVCDNTDVAQIFYEKIAGEKEEDIPDPNNKKKTLTVKRYGSGEVFPELLANNEQCQHTIRIDSKLLAKIDQEEGETKDQAALRLREIIDTVGKRGGIGEQVRCVVSVSMLTEGWDANNVTHILGVRAFGSQLLCEQVVGRGLRRMSYIPDQKTGLLPAEYVDVYGIPFSLIPYKGKPKEDKNKPDPVYYHIYAVEERSSYEIRMPNVERYVYELRDRGIKCNMNSLEPLVVDQTPGEVWLKPTRGYQEDDATPVVTDDFVKHTREEYYKSVRPQQIVFRLAQMILNDLIEGESGSISRERAELRFRARHQLFPELVGIVQNYIDAKVQFKSNLDARELGLEIYARQVVERICDNILPAASKKGKLIAVPNKFRPFNSTADVNYQTTRRVLSLTKSHLNRAMIQSDLEAKAIEILEDMDCVEYFTPNDRQVGLAVPYDLDGECKTYEPDFVVVMSGGKKVMLEIKGVGGKRWDENAIYAKNAAAKKWCEAVTNIGKYGEWAFEISENLQKLRSVLEVHSAQIAEIKPFKFVEPTAKSAWKTCVPLTTLKAAAGAFSDEQIILDGFENWGDEWITWDGLTNVQHGMFVAKVTGKSMEPLIPDNSYCLFRQPTAGTRNGKIVLVWHSGITDPHTDGCFTVKVYQSEKTEYETGEWRHVRIKLNPKNPEYEPIILEPDDEGEVRVVAEFVHVVG